jgi:hypothetical protein
VVDGTPKPGTIMQIKAATVPDGGGRHTYTAWNPGGDGAINGGPVVILLQDRYRGKTWEDAYTAGTRCFLYHCVLGEEYNVRRTAITGTGSPTEDISIGEDLLIVSGTGFVSPVVVGVAAQTPLKYHFRSLEAIADPGMTPGGITVDPAHDLVWCQFKG